MNSQANLAGRRPSVFYMGWLLLCLALILAYRIWVIPRLGISLYVDEAQYWTWAKAPDWGYFSKPPLIGWLIAATTFAFGDGLIAVKLPSLLLYPATSCVLYFLGRRLYNAQIGFRIALAFALMPLVSALGLFVSTDAPLLFFWALSMLLLLRAVEKDAWLDWTLLGVAVGLGCMAKYTMAAFGVSAFIYLAVDSVRRHTLRNPRLWYAVTIAFLIVLPNILWNWANHFPTLHHTADITHIEGADDKHGNVVEFIGAQAASLGPGFAIAFLAGVWWAFANGRQRAQQMVLAFSLPLLTLVLVQSIRSEANGNWSAPALVPALILSVAWLSKLKTRWWIAAMSINVASMFAIYHLQDAFHVMHKTQTARTDPLKRAKGWHELAEQLRPILLQHPDAVLLGEHRTILAHLLYELRDLNLDAVAWAPQERPQDHYQLTIALPDEQTTRPLILVTQSDPSGIEERFTSHTVLADLHIAVEPGVERRATVVLLTGFRGYR